jgi:hypothetical protein
MTTHIGDTTERVTTSEVLKITIDNAAAKNIILSNGESSHYIIYSDTHAQIRRANGRLSMCARKSIPENIPTNKNFWWMST